MKPFFNNKTFLISMGTGIPGARDFSIDAFKKSIQLGTNVISVGIALHNDQIVLKPENYNKSIDKNGGTISFENLIEEFPHMLFNFIILEKDDLLIEKFSHIIQKKEIVDRIIVRSIYKRNIKKIKSLLPDIACAFSLSDIVGFYALYKTGLISLKKNFMCDAIMTTEMIGTSYFANPGVINTAQKMGLKIYIIGAKNKAEIEKLNQAGVDGFVTDDIESFMKICTEQNMHRAKYAQSKES